MKLFKRILLFVFLFIIISGVAGFFYFKNKFNSVPPNRLTVSELGQPFPFTWIEGEIGGKTDPHYAMFVPVTIPGIEDTFYMQFDVGAHSTVFLYNNILSINEKYGDIFQLDSTGERLGVANPRLTVGTVDLSASVIDFLGRGNEIDWSDTTSMKKIGTIGADFIEKNVLYLDFKNQLITLNETLPEAMVDAADLLPFTFEGRKIFLKAEINGEPASLWFDSGSSTFELIVEEKTFKKLAKPGAQKETFTVNSWGTGVVGHNIESEGEFKFGKTTVPLTFVTTMEWPNKLQTLMMKASNIGGDLGGMTGNKLFIDKTLILDVPNLRYTVIP